MIEPSSNGQHRHPDGAVALAAVLLLGTYGLVGLGGLVVQVISGQPTSPFLAGLVGSVAGWLAGLLTPRPR